MYVRVNAVGCGPLWQDWHCPGMLPAEAQPANETDVRRGKYKQQRWILFIISLPQVN